MEMVDAQIGERAKNDKEGGLRKRKWNKLPERGRAWWSAKNVTFSVTKWVTKMKG